MVALVVFRNAFYQMIGRGITAIVTLVTTVLIASNFGSVGYGDFAKVTAIVGMSALIVDFGFNALYLQEKHTPVRFVTFLFVRLLVAVILIAILNGVVFFLPFDPASISGFSEVAKGGFVIFSLSLLFQAVTMCCTALFQKILRYQRLALSYGAGSLITLACVVFVIVSRLSLLFVFASFVAGASVSAVVALFLTREKILLKSFNLGFALRLVRKSFPLGLMLLFNVIYFRADILLLSFLRPTSEVGVYALSYRVFEFLISIPIFLTNSLYPFLLQTSKNPRSFSSLLKRYLLVFVGIAIVVVAIFWQVADYLPLIHVEFAASVVPFRLLLLFLPFFFATSLLQWGLIAKKKHYFLLSVYFVVGAVNVLLNFLLIPHFSYNAAALITGASEVIVFLALGVKTLRTNA